MAREEGKLVPVFSCVLGVMEPLLSCVKELGVERASFQCEWKGEKKMASVISSSTCHNAQKPVLGASGSVGVS